jgi:hypothetical protein
MSRLNNSVSAGEDEDDEAGWAEMKKMKERVKSGWRRKNKGRSQEPEKPQAEGLEALYYPDS